LADLTKQELLISDLNSVEAQLSILISKYKDIVKRNAELEHVLMESRNENSSLSQKILKLQSELENFKKGSESIIFNSLNSKEREDIKVKLQNLISKIDYHLSAS
jgi:DNA-binding winged helix-turn-helix (wHTH) protein